MGPPVDRSTLLEDLTPPPNSSQSPQNPTRSAHTLGAPTETTTDINGVTNPAKGSRRKADWSHVNGLRLLRPGVLGGEAP
ncbi:hypothetical protein TPA0909_12600 [Streptomyces albus]|nr:hypothetical protein TPA0909_12600 [Streptomyces albus]